jgi:hypothetical protein
MRWPFSSNRFSAVVCVHFFNPALVVDIHESLIPGGHLCVETFGAHGQNHLALPCWGEYADLLNRANFRIIAYEERPAGPPDFHRCAVKLLAQAIPTNLSMDNLGGKW